MKRGLLLLFGAFLLVARPAAAQDVSVQEEMRFVQELRNQGKSDLALEYLQRLSKNPSPELAKELPLELAKARLEAAGEEPDSGKRLNLYAEARDEFQKWLTANPGHARSAEVKLDVAQVAVLQGRTQLSQAFMNPDFDAVMVPEAFKARAMLEDAGAQIQQAAKELDAQIAKLTPADKDLKKKLDGDRLQADLNLALNLFDVAMTYPRNAKDTEMAKERGKKVDDAQKSFDKLGARDDSNPVSWVAKAWAGRCLFENGEGPKARTRYNDIIKADERVANEGQRLARYFKLLVVHEKPEGEENDAWIVERGKEWIAKYSGYLKTPEGYGLRFLVGQTYYTLAVEEKDAAKKALDLTEARRYLRQVEQSENDFTDRARRMKIQVIAMQQGGFKEPVEKLNKFEDCYVRAQYEMMEQEKDLREAKTPEEGEKKRKEHQATITAALERGLKLLPDDPKARAEVALELGNAQALLAFQYLNAKRYKEGFAVGEALAHKDPRSAQAAAAAVYALQCYAEMISAEEAAGTAAEKIKPDRDALLLFAGYMEKTWPKETPGDMARHQLALLYFNNADPDPEKRAHNVQDAIRALGRITPSYGNYTVTQYQLAQFCFAADKDKVAPLEGDAEDGYRKRALSALENIPALAAGADPTTNKVYFLAKIRLAQEDFTLKKFDEMEQLTQTLTPLLAGKSLDADPTNNDKLHGEFDESIKSFRLYARWAKADAEFKAAEKAEAKDKPAHFTKIMELLDPVVDEILAKQHPELKSNPSLARNILDNDLRATIQLNKLDRTQVVLNCYKELAASAAADDQVGVAKEAAQAAQTVAQQWKESGALAAQAAQAAQQAAAQLEARALAPAKQAGQQAAGQMRELAKQIKSHAQKPEDPNDPAVAAAGASDLLAAKQEDIDRKIDQISDEVLKQLVQFIPPQLDLLKRSNDAPALEAAKKKYGELLDDTLKPQGDKLTPKLVYFTAKIYSSMDKHKEAADLLDKVPEPAKEAPPSDTDLYQSIRVQTVRERRLNSETEEARKAMDVILGTKTAPGWGAKKIDALMENIELLGAEGKNKLAAETANGLVQQLSKRIDADNKIKELYLQCYYLVVENLYHQAVTLKAKSPANYTTEVKKAAAYAVDLAKKQGGFVNDATRNRYRDLMDAEPDLKAEFLETYLTTAEALDKQAAALKDEKQREKAVSDVAALIVDLEKMWPDYGGDTPKGRVTVLLGEPELKAAYDKLKGTALAP